MRKNEGILKRFGLNKPESEEEARNITIGELTIRQEQLIRAAKRESDPEIRSALVVEIKRLERKMRELAEK